MIIETFPTWAFETNAYVVADEPGGKAIIIDAPPEPVEVGNYLATKNLAVAGIVLTHGHVDHMGGASSLSRSTGGAVWVHKDDDFLTKHPREQLRSIFGMDPPGDFDPPIEPERLRHGAVLDLGVSPLEVRLTPGHTPGHCCLYLRDEGVLFSGDQLFAGSVGRTDFPRGSFEDLMASMREQVMTLPDDVEVLPGHGPATTIGRERLTNPFRTAWAA